MAKYFANYFFDGSIVAYAKNGNNCLFLEHEKFETMRWNNHRYPDIEANWKPVDRDAWLIACKAIMMNYHGPFSSVIEAEIDEMK